MNFLKMRVYLINLTLIQPLINIKLIYFLLKPLVNPKSNLQLTYKKLNYTTIYYLLRKILLKTRVSLSQKQFFHLPHHYLIKALLLLFFLGFFFLKMDLVLDPKCRRQAVNNTVVLPTNSEQISHHRNLNEQIYCC